MTLKEKQLGAKEIRRLIRTSGLYIYQVADELGISDPTITRWLRRLDEGKKVQILKAIERLKSRGDVNER